MGVSSFKPVEGCFDEMAGRSAAVREARRAVETWLTATEPAVLEQRRWEGALIHGVLFM